MRNLAATSSRQLRYRIQALILLLWPPTGIAIRFSGPLFSGAAITTSADERVSSASNDVADSKKSPWWKGLDFGENGGKSKKSQSKEQQETQHEQNNETDEEDTEFPPKDILSPLQLEPLLQIPCSVQMVYHGTASTGTGSFASSSQPIEAFCDTGAQRTVMSLEAAQRLGLAHLVDRRYMGHATGVGSCRVLGRIPAHAVRLQFAGLDGTLLVVTAPAITVLESTGTPGVELLLGLEFLRDTKAIIDLHKEEVRLVSNGRNTEQKPSQARIPFIQHRSLFDIGTHERTKWDKDNNRYMPSSEHRGHRQGHQDDEVNKGDDDDEELYEDENSDYESADLDEEMDMSWL